MDRPMELEVGLRTPEDGDYDSPIPVISVSAQPVTPEESEAAAVLIQCMREGRAFEAFRSRGTWFFDVEGGNVAPRSATAALIAAKGETG